MTSISFSSYGFSLHANPGVWHHWESILSQWAELQSGRGPSERPLKFPLPCFLPVVLFSIVVSFSPVFHLVSNQVSVASFISCLFAHLLQNLNLEPE